MQILLTTNRKLFLKRYYLKILNPFPGIFGIYTSEKVSKTQGSYRYRTTWESATGTVDQRCTRSVKHVFFSYTTQCKSKPK